MKSLHKYLGLNRFCSTFANLSPEAWYLLYTKYRIERPKVAPDNPVAVLLMSKLELSQNVIVLVISNIADD
ncbi:hypothetical protein ACHWQZ_G003548 [Mnemiopsis leidyi]